MITVIGGKSYTRSELVALIAEIEAIVYARVSTADQAKHGYSLESQAERCAEVAKKKFGCNENQIMVIIEPGESGDDPDRPGMNHALFLLENGVGKRLIMLHPDRMSRYLKLQTLIAERIWGCGCEIEFVETPEVDPDNPESMLFFNIQGSIAQYNKAKILANSKRGRMTKARNGKIPGLRRLYGYKFDKELDTLIIDPVESSTYKMMVDWYLNGNNGVEMTCSGIARELAKRGIPAPEGGNKWHQAVVSKILRRDVYTGRFYYGKTEVKQKQGKKTQVPRPEEEWILIEIPRIISDETYQELQEKMTSREKRTRGRQSDNYLVKGIARCGRCGSAVIAGPPTTLKSGKKLRYYTCCQKTRKSFEVGTGEKLGVCYGRSWRQDIVDDYVWKFVENIIRNPDAIIADITRQQQDFRQIDELNNKKAEFERTIKEKEAGVARCHDLFIWGKIDREKLEKLTKPIEEQIQHLKEELFYVDQALLTAKAQNDELQTIKDYVNEYHEILDLDQMDFEGKKAIVNKLISKITLKETNEIDIVIKWTPSSNQKLNEFSEENTHSIGNHSQHYDKKYYVYIQTAELQGKNARSLNFTEKLPEHQRDYTTKTEAIAGDLEKFVRMYKVDKLTIAEIAKSAGVEWWTIKQLFIEHGIERISLKERAKLKREIDFPTIYDLHFNQEKTVAEIYATYGFSPPYVRAVLNDKGLKPINRGKFQKNVNN